MDIEKVKLNLLKRSNLLLEKTKLNSEKYQKERKNLLDFTSRSTVDYVEWENILKYIETIVSLDEKLSLKKSDFQYLKDLAIFLKNQKVRESDNKKTIFKVTDSSNNTHLFLTRNSAEEFIQNNNSNNLQIDIVKNTNEELEHLLELIKRNF